MEMILCDTNIFIEVYRRNVSVYTELERIEYENIAVSDVSRSELFYGALNKTELQMIRKDMRKLTALPIQAEISEMAVSLVESYCLSHKLDIQDALIAATAIYYDIELFTLNLKDFSYIPGVRLYTFQR